MYDVHIRTRPRRRALRAHAQRDPRRQARLSRAPRTYGGWGDEDRRQGLLLMLSSRYRPAGPTQRRSLTSGRTDLLFRMDDRDLFLAECFIWKGSKSLTENVEQLFGGATSARTPCTDRVYA